MAASFSATPCKRKRSDETQQSTDSQDVESSNSATSCESGRSTELKFPQQISRWKKEHLQNLSIVVQYEEEVTPLELLKNYRLRRPSNDNKFLCNYIDKVEEYFLKSCHFHEFLDDEFASISRKKAEFLRNPTYYSANEFLDLYFKHPVSDDVRYWFKRMETAGVRFSECLYFTVLKRDLEVILEDNAERQDPLTEHDFQFLFDAFVSMFCVQSFMWFMPCNRESVLKLAHCEAAGKADILYCQDIAHTVNRPLETLKHVVAVCEVKKKSNEPEQHSMASQKQVSQGNKFPPDISFDELGQHGGKLLLYSQQSVAEDVIFGLFVKETKVSFTALKMTENEFQGIASGRYEKTKPTLVVTKSYDFMKKEDRKYLIKPLLQLSMIQEQKIVS